MSAEVTSNSTPTLCSSLRKKAQEGIADAFKPVGSLTFRIDNFRQFTERPPGLDSHCKAKVSVRGLTFGLAVYPLRPNVLKSLGFIVKCENTNDCDVQGDGSWGCLASVTLRIKSLLESGEDKICKFTYKFFSSSKGKPSFAIIDVESWSFNNLLDPKKSFYNEKDNALKLAMEISADTPIGIMELPKTDIIQVNEEAVFINKTHLAMHSRFFHNMFYNTQFDERKSGEYKVEIEEPATVEHFKRMLDTMCPMNKPLDGRFAHGQPVPGHHSRGQMFGVFDGEEQKIGIV